MATDLGEAWYAHPDDLIGGWCVITADMTPGDAQDKLGVGPDAGWREVANFVREADARHIAFLHNLANEMLPITRAQIRTIYHQADHSIPDPVVKAAREMADAAQAWHRASVINLWLLGIVTFFALLGIVTVTVRPFGDWTRLIGFIANGITIGLSAVSVTWVRRVMKRKRERFRETVVTYLTAMTDSGRLDADIARLEAEVGIRVRPLPRQRKGQ